MGEPICRNLIRKSGARLGRMVDRANLPIGACIGVDLEPPHIEEIVVTAAK